DDASEGRKPVVPQDGYSIEGRNWRLVSRFRQHGGRAEAVAYGHPDQREEEARGGAYGSAGADPAAFSVQFAEHDQVSGAAERGAQHRGGVGLPDRVNARGARQFQRISDGARRARLYF